MEKAFRDLIEFERACGHGPSNGPPAIPDRRTWQIRDTLHAEEFRELADAMIAEDVAEITKEALDLIWVCMGTLVRFGVDAPAAWNELVRSNMSKFEGGVHRREDGKVLKGPHYKPADMAGILESQRSLAETYGEPWL